MTDLLPKADSVRQWLDLTKHPQAWLLVVVGLVVGAGYLWRSDPVAFADAMAYMAEQPLILALVLLAFTGVVAAVSGATVWSLSERLHTAEFRLIRRENDELKRRVTDLEEQALAVGEGGIWHKQWVKTAQQLGKLERIDRATMAALPFALMQHGIDDEHKIAILDAIDRARYSVTDRGHEFTQRATDAPKEGGLRHDDPVPPNPQRRTIDRM